MSEREKAIDEAVAELIGTVETLRSWGYEKEVERLRILLRDPGALPVAALDQIAVAIDEVQRHIPAIPDEVQDAFRRAIATIQRATSGPAD